jgi:hypothetical protein
MELCTSAYEHETQGRGGDEVIEDRFEWIPKSVSGTRKAVAKG